MAATTTLLGLVTPTQGTLSGTWGDTVNYGISDYVDISIAGTLSFAGDGAITLTNTTGSASGNNIGSTTAQYMVIRITGTQTVTKVITGPSYSKLYMVDHAGATSAVTFKATGQSGVSIAVGEKAFVYFNGTDYVKIATSTAGSGTVTAVSVVSANGLAGTSSGGATPALTLSTSITGVLKGNATAISAATAGTDYLAPPSGTAILKANSGGALANATAGTDYVAPGTATTFTATQTFNGTSSVFGTSLLDTNEAVNVVASAPSSTTNYYVQSGSVQYYTTSAANNWTLNVAFSSGTSINTALAIGQSVTFTLVTTQGATAYYNSAVTIDGTSVTPKWIGGAPTAGNASGLDVYRYAVIKTASATYTVLASLTQFK
jgi:hypothetical protein